MFRFRRFLPISFLILIIWSLHAAQGQENKPKLDANGGKETVVMPANVARADKSNTELITQLSDRNHELRRAAEVTLLARGTNIFPDVSAALDDEEHLEVLLSLMQKMGPPAESLFPKLETMLGNPKYVFAVTLCMERISAGSVGKLSPHVRSRAAQAIYKATIDPANAELSGYFLQMLPSYGEPAKPFILKLLRSDKPGYRVAGTKCISVTPFHDMELEKELIKLINSDAEISVRGWAVLAARNPLYHTDGCRLALTELVDELSKSRVAGAEEAVRRATASLATFGNRVIAELVPLVAQGSDENRIAAVNTWESLPVDANSELADLLEHPSPKVVLAASVVLSRRGAEAASAVAHKLSSTDEAVCRTAAEILTNFRGAGDEAVPRLIELAGDSDLSDATRISAARAALTLNKKLARQNDAVMSLVPALIVALNDQSFMQRGKAAETLGLLGPAAKAAIPALEKIAAMTGREVDKDGINGLYPRESAAEAIKTIGRN